MNLRIVKWPSTFRRWTQVGVAGLMGWHAFSTAEAAASLSLQLNVPIEPAESGIFAVALQPDGKVILAGGFSRVLGIARNKIARLNTDGTLDLGFNPSPNDSVIALADPVLFLGREFLTTCGAWLDAQPMYASNDSLSVLGREFFKFFRGRGLDEELIACHGA